MTQNIKLIVYPAKDLESAKSFFTTFLGVQPYTDSPYYVDYKVENMEIGLDPNGKDVISYVDVNDIQSTLDELTKTGATIHQDSKNVGGGMLIAQIKDANGNVLGLRQETK